MSKKFINWDKVSQVINKISALRTYMYIVESSTDDLLWYSNLESVAKIAWRTQNAVSTIKYAIKNLVDINLISTKSRGIYSVNKDYLIV